MRSLLKHFSREYSFTAAGEMLRQAQHDVLRPLKDFSKKLFCFATIGASALGAFDDATSSRAHETHRQFALGRSR